MLDRADRRLHPLPADSPSDLAPLPAPGAWRLLSEPTPALLHQVDQRLSVVAASVWQHAAILALLETAWRTKLADEFLSQAEAPGYDPADRLLAVCDGQPIAHVRMNGRVGWFGGLRTPLVRFEELAVLPEYCDSAAEDALLEQAEDLALREGAVLAVTHATRVEPFVRRGWTPLGAQGYSRVNARGALAHLLAQSSRRTGRSRRWRVATWRHLQLDALCALYEQQAAAGWGQLHRSEAHWRWLIGRGAHDQILVALPRSGGAASENLHAPEPVGYAVVKDSCLVECVSASDHPQTRLELLMATCRDAIERDHQYVSYHAPAGDPLHEVLVTAGGQWAPSHPRRGGCWLTKLLSPQKWIERGFPLWRDAAQAAGIARPWHCDLSSPERTVRLSLTRRSARWQSRGAPGGRWVRGGRSTLDALLLGNLNLAAAQAEGWIDASSPELLRQLGGLFPSRACWQSPWELIRL